MRVLSSPKVIAEADNALRMIIDTYTKENTTFSGVRQSISHGFPDPLRAFSEACHIDRHGAAARRFDQVGLAAFVNPRSGC
jgi:hypothetical protein